LIVSDTEGAYYKQTLGINELWHYALIAPDGEIVEKGNAGSYYVGTDTKEFEIKEKVAAFIQRYADSTTTRVPSPGIDPVLMRAAFLAETGRLYPALSHLQANASVSGAKPLETHLTTLLENELATLLKNAENESAPNRFTNFMALRELVTQAKDLDLIKPYRTAVLKLKRDNAFRDELKAEQTWESFIKQLEKVAKEKRQETMLQELPVFVKKYGDTVYGKMAQSLLIPAGVGP
jgi:hypothetical protein